MGSVRGGHAGLGSMACQGWQSVVARNNYFTFMEEHTLKNSRYTVNVQIFVGTIFRGD